MKAQKRLSFTIYGLYGQYDLIFVTKHPIPIIR